YFGLDRKLSCPGCTLCSVAMPSSTSAVSPDRLAPDISASSPSVYRANSDTPSVMETVALFQLVQLVDDFLRQIVAGLGEQHDIRRQQDIQLFLGHQRIDHLIQTRLGLVQEFIPLLGD